LAPQRRRAVVIARYRSKDDVDLRWNSIRRRATRELDTQIADWREAALNQILGALWNEYKAALHDGTVLELEAHYTQFVTEALASVIEVEPVEVVREAA
jgi:hypothetical protein